MSEKLYYVKVVLHYIKYLHHGRDECLCGDIVTERLTQIVSNGAIYVFTRPFTARVAGLMWAWTSSLSLSQTFVCVYTCVTYLSLTHDLSLTDIRALLCTLTQLLRLQQ